jgi:hypothetical protein
LPSYRAFDTLITPELLSLGDFHEDPSHRALSR